MKYSFSIYNIILKHKSVDYKKLIVEYYLVGDKSQLEVCEIFKYSAKSLICWVEKIWKRTYSVFIRWNK